MFQIAGLWIVSSKWISDSLLAGRVLQEDEYEISKWQKALIDDAPKRARLAIKTMNKIDNKNSIASYDYQILDIKQPSSFQINNQFISHENSKSLSDNKESENGLLFSNIVFLLYGSFPNSGPHRQHIAALLLAGQAIVVTSIKALYDHKESKPLVPHKIQNCSMYKLKKVRKFELS